MFADLPFWQSLARHGDAIALFDARSNSTVAYRDLHAKVREAARLLDEPHRGVVLLLMGGDVDGVVSYIAALATGHAVLLAPSNTKSESLDVLVRRYRPDLILASAESPDAAARPHYRSRGFIGSHAVLVCDSHGDPPPHPGLGLILSTSASTGSAKCVRLSRDSVAVSARQVSNALKLNPDERSLVTLPFSHVYGLSVLHGHLQAGACLILNGYSVADRRLWELGRDAGATNFAAVTQTLEYLRIHKLTARHFPHLRALTHSGSALPLLLFEWLYRDFRVRDIDIYLMYGQTEACGRISVLPPEALPGHFGAVGRAVEHARLELAGSGEIRFVGPNVMWGYANGREDLSLGDCLDGCLATGDTGHIDEAGFLHVTGRVSRYCKVNGQRISLDEVEASLSDSGPVAAISHDDRLVVFFEAMTEPPARDRVLQLAIRFQLPPQAVRFHPIPMLPRTALGKIAYSQLPHMEP